MVDASEQPASPRRTYETILTRRKAMARAGDWPNEIVITYEEFIDLQREFPETQSMTAIERHDYLAKQFLVSKLMIQ